MADDEPVAAATETSPLLGEAARPEPAPSTSGGAENGAAEPDDGARREGMPEVAVKMHLLIPAVGIGIYLCAVDQLLTVATYTKIGNELNALNSTSWIATAYFLALTSFQPLYGRLSDIFGRKECLLFAYAVFGIGSLGCGLARDMAQLCVSRAVAGLGGGGMNAVVSILISDIVPLRERGVWQGYINIIFAAGTATGAPLGGLLADSVGWRWSFLGQVPLCVAAFLSVYFVLDLPPISHAHWRHKVARVDFLGAATLVLAVTSLLVGLDSGSNLGWRHPATLAGLAAAPVLFALFIFVEMRVAAHPFAPGHVVFGRALVGCYAANFFGVAGQIAQLFFAPLFFQAVQGRSATASGALLLPCMAAAVAASLGGGLVIKRTGRYYRVTVVGFLVLLLSIAPMVAGVLLGSTPGVVGGLVVCALGAGSGITTTLVALLANAAVEDTAVVIACSYLFRSLGSSIGISTSSAVLQLVLRAQLAARLPDGEQARLIEEKVRESLDYIKELPPAIAAEVRLSYRYGIAASFIPAAIYLLLAFVATFFIREKAIGK